ncbi:39S ribosomal protein L18, mitochondrial-like [Macrosteles quadrilineatus]|uniref:39S ribosomal protein L18, mitochondrial-like n=1 Tax=Macrosteles quadrilineatus TaxID=74068 RepID=UPI0023E0BD1E|nr:39S ribosomal protein L18, mitochondrial-like [Macrosteles quadrilineatus]XP_054289966.1 39S ribosomal protein L18, mitochondrial-like [Macrosteles quadrilineatus]XP_054289967.1 39S ribosomal protein L18, mitochondrial-like [Macrosteles quadrilineatus]
MSSFKTMIRFSKHFSRSASTAADASSTFYCYNRNPRNLEKLRIAHKPVGWFLEKPGKTYWNKLVVKTNRSARSVTGEVVHNSGTVVVSASTKEWALAKQLYSLGDTAAYVNLARVLAQRCHETGISEVACFIERKPDTKVEAFLQELEKEGVTLSEPEEYEHPRPTQLVKPEKPWEVY